jgi:hypothetical protein
MVLLVGKLNFAIRQNILHVTEINLCRPAAVLCDSQKRAATPRTCMYDHSKSCGPPLQIIYSAVGGRPYAPSFVRN